MTATKRKRKLMCMGGDYEAKSETVNKKSYVQ